MTTNEELNKVREKWENAWKESTNVNYAVFINTNGVSGVVEVRRADWGEGEVWYSEEGMYFDDEEFVLEEGYCCKRFNTHKEAELFADGANVFKEFTHQTLHQVGL